MCVRNIKVSCDFDFKITLVKVDAPNHMKIKIKHIMKKINKQKCYLEYKHNWRSNQVIKGSMLA